MVKQKTNENKVWYALAVGRIMLGFIFLWAFFDKWLGLGISTPKEGAWVNGGSPTLGYLSNVQGPFAGMFHALAGLGWVDWLFMLGLLGIGVGLFFGVATRLSTFFGSVMLLLMWMASLPLANNPYIDDHLVYIALLVAIGHGLNHQKLSLGEWWSQLPLVRENDWLK